MKHGIGVDTVVLGIATGVGVDPTLEVALLLEQVVEIECHDEGLALEEGLGDLSVPDEFVGVHRRVVISPTAVFADVGADLEPCRQTQQDLSAVAELPRIEVGIGLQLVACVLVVDVSIECHFQPVVAETEIQALIEIGGAGGVLLCICLSLCHIAHIVIVTHTCVGSQVPVAQRIDGGIEGEAAIGIPVAVDVLRSRHTSTGLGVVADEVGDGVADVAVVSVKHNGALVLADVVLVIDVQRIGELWFQSWVTLCDVERVGVVGDVEQLCDVGLTGIATIVEPDIVLVAELIMVIDCRREVYDVADGIDIDASVVLNEVGALWLEQHTHVVVVLFLPVAQGQTDVVGVVLIFREAAQVTVKIVVERHEVSNPGIPLAIGRYDASEGIEVHVAEVEGLTVAFVLVVAQLVTCLQVCTFSKRFAVVGTQDIAAVVGRSGVVASREVGGILVGCVLHKEQMHIVV